MRRLLLAGAVLCASVARAYADNGVGQSIDDFGLPIDLQQSCDDAAFNDLIEPVSFFRGNTNTRRLYIAGIVGDSFATLGTPLGPNGNGTGDPSPSPARVAVPLPMTSGRHPTGLAHTGNSFTLGFPAPAGSHDS